MNSLEKFNTPYIPYHEPMPEGATAGDGIAPSTM
jgi:hypothetical protein